MIKGSFISFGLLGVLMLAACGASMGRKIDEAKVKNIQPCVTTQKELLDWFGEPSQRGNQNGLETVQWMYAHTDVGVGTGQSQTQSLIAVLNKEGKVSQFFLNPTSMPDAKDTCADQAPDAGASPEPKPTP